MCNGETVQTSQISLGMHAPCTAETSQYAHSIMQLDVAVILYIFTQ